MLTRVLGAAVAILCFVAGGEAAEQGNPNPAERPWIDAGPPSAPELLEMVTPGSEWREEGGKCVLRVEKRTAKRRGEDVKGIITYPDGQTVPFKGFIDGGRMILIAPYEFARNGRVGTAIAPMAVIDGKVGIYVDWHQDHKDPQSKPVRLVSPLKPPPERPRGNGT